MSKKTLVILIIVIGLGVGGFFVWKNIPTEEITEEKVIPEEQ